MTHVSKKKLTKKQQSSLHSQFVTLLIAADTSRTTDLFTQLFTKAEQIMFIKRVAMIGMIGRGYSKYRVAQTLNVSESTVARIALGCEIGQYDAVLSLLQTKQFDSKKFWHIVEVVLRGGMPPMDGRRWQYLNKHT